MNVLIIAPHADDEVLGCGGLMTKRVAQGAQVDVAVAALGGERAPGSHEDYAARRAELVAASRILGVSEVAVLYPGYNMRLDELPRVEIVSKLDALLRRDYDEVYLPYASANHDHQIVYQCTLAALRPYASERMPRLVAAYEYAQIGWQLEAVAGGQMFVDIASEFERKLQALAAYESQLRPHPHPCSEAAVRTLAQFRGLAIGKSYAELFYILRATE